MKLHVTVSRTFTRSSMVGSIFDLLINNVALIRFLDVMQKNRL